MTKKKIVSLLLVISMIITILPMGAIAEGTDNEEEEQGIKLINDFSYEIMDNEKGDYDLKVLFNIKATKDELTNIESAKVLLEDNENLTEVKTEKTLELPIVNEEEPVAQETVEEVEEVEENIEAEETQVELNTDEIPIETEEVEADDKTIVDVEEEIKEENIEAEETQAEMDNDDTEIETITGKVQDEPCLNEDESPKEIEEKVDDNVLVTDNEDGVVEPEFVQKDYEVVFENVYDILKVPQILIENSSRRNI